MTAPTTRATTAGGIPVLTFDDIGSTNAEAMRLGLGGAATPLWLTAARQTAGRGRSGRPWASEPGNLYASLVIRVSCPPTVIHQLSFVAAVAAVVAIRRVDANDRLRTLRLKWPNDVLIDGAKCVGILPESSITGPDQILAVIGTGINLAHAPDSLGRATTCLKAHGCDVTPTVMLDELSAAMRAALALWADGAGFATIRARWLQDATPTGTPMTVHTGADTLGGTFAGLDADGALILRDHTGYDRRLSFGDVTLDRDNKPAAGG